MAKFCYLFIPALAHKLSSYACITTCVISPGTLSRELFSIDKGKEGDVDVEPSLLSSGISLGLLVMLFTLVSAKEM